MCSVQVNCDVIFEGVRRRRDVGDNNTIINCSDFCPAISYIRTEDFSAMFGIIAFVTIVLLVAVFAISWAMWTMDPGKDSIVYQMTAPRIKAE